MSPELASDALLQLLALTLIHGTALALLTWAAEATVLRRCRPSVKAALWTVVLVKFLVPPLLPGGYGLSTLIGSLGRGASAVVIVAPQSPASEQKDGVSPAHTPREKAAFTDDPRPHSDPRSYLPPLLLLSYAAPLLFLISKALLHSRRAGQRVRGLPAAGDELTDEVCALSRRLGLRRAPGVRLDAAAASPYVIGAWRPTLVLPAGSEERLDPRAREALIIHELAHIRRGDLLVRWLQNVARLVFFFWPPVWWICRRIERFSEMACDQWAVSLSSAGPRLYAESLLEAAKGVRAGALVKHELGFAARRAGMLRARFEMILGGAHDAPPRLSWRVATVLIGWGLFALTGGVVAGGERNPRVAGAAATGLASSAQAREESADAPHARTPAARADAPQQRPHERRRAETHARGARRAEPAVRATDEDTSAQSAGRADSVEVAAGRPADAQDRKPETTSHSDDLDGDGTVSHFESGFGAARRYERHRRSRRAAGCGSCEPCAADCAGAERRREIELGARRLRPTGRDLP